MRLTDTAERNAAGLIGRRAAQYVRMSTDEQDYSTLNQQEAIAAYALAHNFVVVRTYADEAKSGLHLASRPGLKQLLKDVQAGQVDYEVILVYDVSRWGRFQDVDEGAYYEQICKFAGVRVIYCSEDFENDGSLLSILHKALERADAAHYSRRLSVRVFAGQCTLVRRGFWQGGSPGYGLRRALLDANGSPKGILRHGERKAIQSDRIILVPGPQHEVETVQRIYRLYVTGEKTTVMIANELNALGTSNGYGRPWTKTSVRKILTSEKYVGSNVFNRSSTKLKGKSVKNAPEEWIRVENAFEAVVQPSLFNAASRINNKFCQGITNVEMLSRLAVLLEKRGRLSCRIINEAEGMPHSTLYRHRFGNLAQAYAKIGYCQQGSAFEYREIKRILADRLAAVANKVIEEIERSGQAVALEGVSKTYLIGGKLLVSIFVVRHAHTASGSREWVIQSRSGFPCEQIIAVRMDPANQTPLDYSLLPTEKMHPTRVNLARRRVSSLDPYRHDTLEAMVRSIGLLVAAKG